MKIILILVLFNLQSGSEVITAEFDDDRACELAALRTFQGVTTEPDLRPLEPAGGATPIDGTVIARDSDGAEIGMYSCNPSRSDGQNG